ncbi:MAG: ABC transporter ATP-binding protein [Candidatus Hydrogenedentota bacterium]|nr:MAG: ABC transporter ATP-binding protein [Candidatus Hydrogenedentota bacterium]
MLTCLNLTFRYGDTVAVNRLSFTIRRGEIFGLLGPNGAGKTTTLKILGGLLQLQEGAVEAFGFSLEKAPREIKRITAFLPDRPHVYERLTAWEYLAFVASLWNLPENGRWRETARSLLRRLELENDANRLLESFSQGMRQKLMLIAGFIHEPKLWILDEPLTALDPRSARFVRSLLRSEAEKGSCILLSTHILDTAERFCDRIAILDHGSLVAEGTVAELLDRSDAAGKKGAPCLEDAFLRLVPQEDTSVKP